MAARSLQVPVGSSCPQLLPPLAASEGGSRCPGYGGDAGKVGRTRGGGRKRASIHNFGSLGTPDCECVGGDGSRGEWEASENPELADYFLIAPAGSRVEAAGNRRRRSPGL